MRIASMLSSSLDGCAQHPARETMMRLVVVATPARQFIYFEHTLMMRWLLRFSGLTAASAATARCGWYLNDFYERITQLCAFHSGRSISPLMLVP